LYHLSHDSEDGSLLRVSVRRRLDQQRHRHQQQQWKHEKNNSYGIDGYSMATGFLLIMMI
jgi:hypothetical protein